MLGNKRYVLLAGDHYESNGGMQDAKFSFTTSQEYKENTNDAIEGIGIGTYDWVEVFDTVTNKSYSGRYEVKGLLDSLDNKGTKK